VTAVLDSKQGAATTVRLAVPDDVDAFLCPECGSRQVVNEELRSPGSEYRAPLGGAARRVLCAGCRRWIPGELAYRLGGMTEKQARLGWRAIFWYDDTDEDAEEDVEEKD
jgi:predicted RNA-binding Zn-ribbon protein involved in translation (DUF1610 family)